MLAIYQQNPAGGSTDPVDSVPADRLAAFSNYNTGHQPQTYVDAAGQTTTFTYNGQGQILTRTVTRNGQPETTTWNYTNNYLMSITGPVAGATTSFTYDSHDRIRTATDSEGYTLTYSYDTLDRVTRVSYPDGTYTQTIYDRWDPAWERDRMGRWTQYTHDALRHLATVKNPKGETTIYNWCKCGALDKIIDPNGNPTTFERDVQSRPTKKIYADNSQEIYTYESATSRLHTFLDPRNETKTYSYNLDDSLDHVTYANAQYSTPQQSYQYDTVYPRLSSATRGTTATAFTYYPVTTGGTLGANQLWKVDGPLSGTTDELVYTYDELGRALSARINGTGETVTYDALGRMAGAVNPLGTFTNTYINQTGRVDTITRTGGQFTVDYGYLPNNQDQRLAQIKTMGPSSAVISKFDYTYDAAGDIKTWTQQQAGNPQIWTMTYDLARQLESAIAKDSVSGNTVDIYSYDYDAAGNRKSRQKNGSVSSATYNSLNQLSLSGGSGKMIFEGTVSEPAEVTVAGVPAQVNANNVFRVAVSVGGGTNDLPIVATDGNGNTTTPGLKVRLTLPSVSAGLFTHDANGNLTGDTGLHGYEWDAENRLIAINYPGTNDRTEFDYDGLGRRIKITEKTNSTVTSTKNLVWIGDSIAEERDASNAVTRRFYGEGEQIGGTAYFYGKDHLGSIRDLVDANGVMQTSYSYSPWGERSYETYNPAPVSGSTSQRSEAVAGEHQHYFFNASTPLSIGTGDKLTCWVWIDPKNLPREVMLQWNDGSSWEHRAYWGEDILLYGARTSMGALPATGSWVRLEIPASSVGLEGLQVKGVAFSLYDGRVWWDAAGKRANGAGSDTVWVDDSVPAGAAAVGTWTWTPESVDATFGFTGHYYHSRSGLHLAKYRAYDASLGRWISRDPIGEDGGINLYAYVSNDPISLRDSLGLYITYGTGSAEFWGNYGAAYQMMRNSRAGKNVIEYLENSDKEVMIQGASAWDPRVLGNTSPTSCGGANVTINQDSFKSIFKFDSKWRTLPHELFHAAGQVASGRNWIFENRTLDPAGVGHTHLPSETGRRAIEFSATRAANIIAREAGDSNPFNNSYPGLGPVPAPGGCSSP